MKCPYCSAPVGLVNGEAVYPHRPDLFERNFWVCAPCDAYVGCHAKGARVPVRGGTLESDGTLPLGTPANAALRELRKSCHLAFDGATWKAPQPVGERVLTRFAAYKWLATTLGISVVDCHFAQFSEDMCRRVIKLMRNSPPSREQLFAASKPKPKGKPFPSKGKLTPNKGKPFDKGNPPNRK